MTGSRRPPPHAPPLHPRDAVPIPAPFSPDATCGGGSGGSPPLGPDSGGGLPQERLQVPRQLPPLESDHRVSDESGAVQGDEGVSRRPARMGQ